MKPRIIFWKISLFVVLAFFGMTIYSFKVFASEIEKINPENTVNTTSAQNSILSSFPNAVSNTFHKAIDVVENERLLLSKWSENGLLKIKSIETSNENKSQSSAQVQEKLSLPNQDQLIKYRT